MKRKLGIKIISLFIGIGNLQPLYAEEAMNLKNEQSERRLLLNAIHEAQSEYSSAASWRYWIGGGSLALGAIGATTIASQGKKCKDHRPGEECWDDFGKAIGFVVVLSAGVGVGVPFILSAYGQSLRAGQFKNLSKKAKEESASTEILEKEFLEIVNSSRIMATMVGAIETALGGALIGYNLMAKRTASGAKYSALGAGFLAMAAWDFLGQTKAEKHWEEYSKSKKFLSTHEQSKPQLGFYIQPNFEGGVNGGITLNF